ncbi:MAG TPA: SDR family oxidoreductase [Alphaproteobacteria bacterium]|jgi:3-oxoacyl-[acyl-carrier protein] reductase|nr:SDR family oxidoreductase [Alphaproteobacteria bacterium]
MADTKRTVCVIGATGGIGAACVRAFGRAGDTLVGMDLPGPGLEAFAQETGVAYEIDLADPDSVARAFAAARDSHPVLDVLVITSGIVENKTAAETSLELWDRIQAVNLRGTFLCIQAALPWVRDGGRIVTLGSQAGRSGGGVTGPSYSASKAGIEGLTRAIAKELSPRRITVNCVTPGPVDTPMLDAHPKNRIAELVALTPLGRLTRPDEVAAAVMFLASEAAAQMTGIVLPINGGLRMD